MNIDELTVKQLREIRTLLRAKPAGAKLPFAPDDTLLIRTVTMILLGRLRSIGRDFFVLEDGGWVADTGRFGEMLAKGTINEFERAPSWFVVGRGAVVDIFPWSHEIPKASK